MNLTQVVTLELTEPGCRDFVTELGELEGIASEAPDGLNTHTGLVVLHRIRDLLEQHGPGIRQQLETDAAYMASQLTRQPSGPPVYPPQPPAHAPDGSQP